MDITQGQIDAIQSQWNTVEEIYAWAAMLLHYGNPTLRVVEGENVTEFAAQISIFTANDGSERLVARCSLPLSSTYLSSGVKLWNSINPLSNPSIPAAYLS